MGFDVYVTRRIPEPGLEVLRKECEVVDLNPEDRVLSRKELLTAIKGRDGVLCLLTDKIDGEVFDAAKGAKVFANYAVGYDNIDVAAATKRKIAITNTPGVLTDATSDMAWALLFSAARRTAESDRYTRAGKFKGWGPMLFLGGDITGRTLGIVGAGRIGSAFAKKSIGFRMKVLYTDVRPNEELEKEVGAKKVDFDTLLRESDFISVHVPLSEETQHLMGAREFGLMKRTAYLINTSRGSVVDEKALAKALKEGKMAGAGLDVYEREPEVEPELMKLDNVVLAPHLGSATIETRSKMATMAANNLVVALKGRVPPNIVNPEVFKK